MGQQILPKEKIHNSKKRKELIFLFCMLSLSVIHWLVFWLYVNVNSIQLAFQHPRTDEYTLSNFKSAFDSLSNGTIKIALENTLIFFAVQLFISMPLGIILVYFLYKKVYCYKAFRVIFYFPAIIPGVAMIAGYTGFISPDGPLGNFVRLFGGVIPQEGLLTDRWSANLVMLFYGIWTGFSGGVLILSGAMARIPLELLESAKLEGVKAMRELRSIVLPLIWPTVSTTIILAFTGIFTASGPILLFTNGEYDTTTLSFWMFKEVYGNGQHGGTGTYNLVSAVGLIFTVIGVPIILFIRWLMDKISTAEY